MRPQAAKGRELTGKYVIPLQNTTQQPLLTSLADRAVREKLFNASWTRAEKGDANDTRAIIAELAVIRAEKAKLLGYPNYAAYVLYDQMAQTPAGGGQIHQPAGAGHPRQGGGRSKTDPGRHRQGREAFRSQALGLAALCRKGPQGRYDLDEDALKPYFELHKVLEDGVFYAATQL